MFEIQVQALTFGLFDLRRFGVWYGLFWKLVLTSFRIKYVGSIVLPASSRARRDRTIDCLSRTHKARDLGRVRLPPVMHNFEPGQR